MTTNTHGGPRTPGPVRDRRTRLELVVSLSQRSEGELPQLIAVRNKGAANSAPALPITNRYQLAI